MWVCKVVGMSQSHRETPAAPAARVPIAAPEEVDPQWQEKITQAREARETMQRVRAGKPKSFRRTVGKTS